MSDYQRINLMVTAGHAAADRIEELENFASWVETWVSNPVGAYSVSAIDGLFGMARDKLAEFRAEVAPAGPALPSTERDPRGPFNLANGRFEN
jgi:hypothetical protein